MSIERTPPSSSARTVRAAASGDSKNWPLPAALMVHGQAVMRPREASQRPLSTRPIASNNPAGRPLACSAAMPARSQALSEP